MLAERVRTLVGEYFGGNLSRAAQACAMPYATLHDIASGRTPSPSLDALVKLADGLGVTLDFLAGREATPGHVETEARARLLAAGRLEAAAAALREEAGTLRDTCTETRA